VAHLRHERCALHPMHAKLLHSRPHTCIAASAVEEVATGGAVAAVALTAGDLGLLEPLSLVLLPR
jgi:hypothetical protein